MTSSDKRLDAQQELPMLTGSAAASGVAARDASITRPSTVVKIAFCKSSQNMGRRYTANVAMQLQENVEIERIVVRLRLCQAMAENCKKPAWS